MVKQQKGNWDASVIMGENGKQISKTASTHKKKKKAKNSDKNGANDKDNTIEEESGDDDDSENEFQNATWQEMLHDNRDLKD